MTSESRTKIFPYIYDYLGVSIEQSLFMRPVDEEEVITTVTGCTKKRSSDFEDISMDTVAKVVSVICKPLAHICNISFRTGVFPSRMKNAKQCLKAAQKLTFLIIGQFLSCHNSQKSWKNCSLPE